jgi:hypothetical protein
MLVAEAEHLITATAQLLVLEALEVLEMET